MYDGKFKIPNYLYIIFHERIKKNCYWSSMKRWYFFLYFPIYFLCAKKNTCRCVIPMMRFIRKKEEHLKLMGSRKTWNFSKTTAFYLTRRIRLMPFSYRQSILDDISHSGREHREMWRREIPPHVHLNLCVQLWRC